MRTHRWATTWSTSEPATWPFNGGLVDFSLTNWGTKKKASKKKRTSYNHEWWHKLHSQARVPCILCLSLWNSSRRCHEIHETWSIPEARGQQKHCSQGRKGEHLESLKLIYTISHYISTSKNYTEKAVKKTSMWWFISFLSLNSPVLWRGGNCLVWASLGNLEKVRRFANSEPLSHLLLNALLSYTGSHGILMYSDFPT